VAVRATLPCVTRRAACGRDSLLTQFTEMNRPLRIANLARLRELVRFHVTR
jgi:hypothetical protein